MNKFSLFNRIIFPGFLTLLGAIVPNGGALAAGGVNGGGGKGVLCDGRPEVLDLYEAKQNKLPIPIALGTTDGEIDRFGVPFFRHFFTTALKEGEQQALLVSLKELLNNLDSPSTPSSFIFKWRSNLPFTKDATLPKLNPGCKFIQIAVHKIVKINSEEKIEVSIDPQYWSQLDSINKVALFFHEFSYSRQRSGYNLSDIEKRKLTSDETRKVIGMIFSGTPLPTIIGPVLESKYRAWCGFGGGSLHGGDEEHFEVYLQEEMKGGTQGLGLYFYGFKERLVASQTYGFLPDFIIDDLVEKHFPSSPSTGPVERRKPGFVPQTIMVRNEIMNKDWVVRLGADQWGINIQAYLPGTPKSERPTVSAGFCHLELE